MEFINNLILFPYDVLVVVFRYLIAATLWYLLIIGTKNLWLDYGIEFYESIKLRSKK